MNCLIYRGAYKEIDEYYPTISFDKIYRKRGVLLFLTTCIDV